MTYEEALEYAKSYITLNGIPIDAKEATSCIIDALEKQIPKKPIVVQDSWYVDVDEERIFDIFQCPACNKQVNETSEQTYCWNCGQRIDWSEVE